MRTFEPTVVCALANCQTTEWKLEASICRFFLDSQTDWIIIPTESSPVTEDQTDNFLLTEEEMEKSIDELCDAACYTHASCENCTETGCMWCSNEQRCVESNSYVASFPYGQCMEWTTQPAKCPGEFYGRYLLRLCSDVGVVHGHSAWKPWNIRGWHQSKKKKKKKIK